MSAYSGIYTDMQGLAELRTRTTHQPDSGLEEVAGQFEALFTRMMLKTMRDSSMNSELFNSNRSSQYTEMFDAQVAVEMSRGRGLGLKGLLVRQLGERVAGPTAAGPAGDARPDWRPGSKEAFIEGLRPFARRVERELGISHKAVLAQAALESGWGRHTMRRPDGSNSFNLFGIKADSSWSGDKVVLRTLEFDEGVASRETARFRAYGSLAEAVEDYSDFMRNNPRYRRAIEQGGDPHAYARELQRAGYATDPAYADKIRDILGDELLRDQA